MSNNKYLELAKKLNALAEGGVDGEKYNAKKALDNLMAKHGITKEQLEQNILEKRRFKVHTQHTQLFYQVAMSVIGNRGRTYWQHRTKRNIIFLETTAAEQIEVQTKFDFYLNAFKVEQKTLLRAFIMRHNLYNFEAEGKTTDELSMEELEAIAKAANLARGMETHHYQQQLKPGN